MPPRLQSPLALLAFRRLVFQTAARALNGAPLFFSSFLPQFPV